jgi:hypothetical protein
VRLLPAAQDLVSGSRAAQGCWIPGNARAEYVAT